MRGDILYVERLPLGINSSTSFRENPDSCFLDRLIFRFLTYKHYGVDVGNGNVIHFHCSSILKIHRASITQCSLEEFSKDGVIEIDNPTGHDFSLEEIACRAESKLFSDFDGYRIKHNNCEHFSMWCATGYRISKQDLLRDAWHRCLGVSSLAKRKALSAMSAFTFLQ